MSAHNDNYRSGEGVGVPRIVRHLDLFSGIGGFALAAQMVGGVETIGFCEIDPWARKVLAKNFPGVPCHDDVKTLEPKNYGRIDLITGGFPCQPFSHAGKRGGKEDDRHLWPEMLRIINESRPRWVLGENVPGIVSMALDNLLSDLGAIDYEPRTLIVQACALDAPHIRERVYIVAHSMRGRESLGRDMGGTWREQELDEEQPPWEEASESPILGDDARLPKRLHRPRCKALGNSIVPQVAAKILHCMMKADSLASQRNGEETMNNEQINAK